MRYFSFILLISLVSSLTLSQVKNEKLTGWPTLYHLDPTATSYPLPKSYNSNYLKTKSVPIWEENSEIFIDSTTFTPVDFSFPGVMAGNAVWFDFDNDSDLDIIVSGLTDSKEFLTKIYRNDRGNFKDIEAPIIPLWTERGVAWGDYDNDGDFDLAIQGRLDTTGFNNVTKIYRNDDGNFIDINASLMGLCGGSVIWADFDNDGLLDLLISGSPDNGSTFYTKIYKKEKDNFVDINAHLPGVWGSSIAAGDYDNDGDLDILLTGYGHYSTITRLYRNELQNDKITFVDTYAQLQAVNSSAVAWGDYDNDGYLDICLSGISFNVPITKIYRNNGGESFIDINAPLKPMAVSALAWGDYDNDGDLDLAVSGAEDFWYGTNPTTKIYRNDSGMFVDINANITGTWFGSLTWGDYDGDGKLDLLMTGGTVSRPYFHYLGPYYPVTKNYKNNSQNSNTSPSTPNNLSIIVSQGKTQLKWDPSTDNQTPNNTLTYNLRIGKTPGGHEVFSPISNMSTGYRRTPKEGNQGFLKNWNIRNLPPGTYYWSVQAIDNSYTGSPFADEHTFTVTSSGDIIEENVPNDFYLYQNYPNPFNPSTHIAFSLPKETFITVKIFDLLGREIVSLMNEVKPKGKYEIEWDASNFPAGVYYCKLKSNEYFALKKMILIK
jgi:predicted nucleotidyltransferase